MGAAMHALRDRHEPLPRSGTAGSSRPVAAAGLLHLQRVAGNAAVQRLITVQRGCSCGQSQEEEAVQRCAAGPIAVAPIAVEEEEAAAVQALSTLQRDGEPVPMDTAKTSTTPAPGCPIPSSFSVFQDKPGGDGSGKAAGTPTGLNGFKDGHFVVTFDAASSWVDTNLVAKSGQRLAKTQKRVDDCKAGFAKGDTSHTSTGQTLCPASKSVDRSAKNAGECETVIGAGFDAEDRADVPRLLTHEQYHVKLVCAAATKAEATLPPGTKKVTKQVAAVYKSLGEVLQPNSDAYDADSANGCNATGQATWQTNIDAGKVKIAP